MQQSMIHDSELSYRLIKSRKRKKTLSLTITETGDIVVQAPYHMPVGEIDAFFKRKKHWIEDKLRQLQERPSAPLSGSLTNSRSLLFQGKAYPLVLKSDGLPAELFTFIDGRFNLNSRILHHRKAIVRAWYEGQARAYFPQRVTHYGTLFGLQASGIRISRAQSRWGSCSPKNVLAFTWRLMMAPPPVIDYVVIHELAHIREKNHSRSFWSLVAAMMPEYAAHRQWLKTHGHQLLL